MNYLPDFPANERCTITHGMNSPFTMKFHVLFCLPTLGGRRRKCCAPCTIPKRWRRVLYFVHNAHPTQFTTFQNVCGWNGAKMWVEDVLQNNTKAMLCTPRDPHERQPETLTMRMINNVAFTLFGDAARATEYAFMGFCVDNVDDEEATGKRSPHAFARAWGVTRYRNPREPSRIELIQWGGSDMGFTLKGISVFVIATYFTRVTFPWNPLAISFGEFFLFFQTFIWLLVFWAKYPPFLERNSHDQFSASTEKRGCTEKV